jgi:transaldolase
MSNMQRTAQLGADFWNDSCDLRELGEAVANGAVGATSNPVIVHQAVNGAREVWFPMLDALVREHPRATEDELAWMLIERMGARAAELLAKVHERTGGRKGFLSMQVDPRLYRDPERMAAHGHRLAAVAPNVAIKIPATPAGIAAIEQLTSDGIRINATVCFTVPQALACAEAVERGVAAARARGLAIDTLLPTVTLMVGRLDDNLRRVFDREDVSIDPGHVHWAGIAVFKRARALFRERGYRATLLAAAYRHLLHWTELVGEGVILTMPYKWWKQFDASDVRPEPRLDRPVDPGIVGELYARFRDFRRAYDADGMHAGDFERYGATQHTLLQFLNGYQQLAEVVRQRMLG